jgi:hypothetical protein
MSGHVKHQFIAKAYHGNKWGGKKKKRNEEELQ